MVNQKGSVVMIGLWILSVLAVLAVNLGWRAQAGLKLAGNQRDKLKASFLAKAGLSKAMYLLSEDAKDVLTKDYDALNACGVNLGGKEAKEIFREENAVWGGSFDIGYSGNDGGLVYGMRDEESRININGTTDFDKNKLIALFGLKGVENGDELSNYIISWICANDSEMIINIPAEIRKKESFVVAEELLLVFEYFYKNKGVDNAREKAQEEFSKVKDMVTVNSAGKINLNTASFDVLNIIFTALIKAEDIVDANEAAASGLADKIMEFRGRDYIFDIPGATGVIDKLKNSVEIVSAQENIITALFTKNLADIKSDNFRVEVSGKAGKMLVRGTAIIERSELLKMVSYRYD